MRRTILALTLLGFTAFGQTRSRLADYALILEDPPVAAQSQSRAELFSAKMQPHLQKVRTAQQSVLNELARRKVTVAGASQVLLNAVFVTTDRATAMQLGSIPGVARVAYLPRLKPDLNTAVNLINAPAAWAALGGAANAGAGIKIGIIDSGIDQTHAAFQDSSLTPPLNYPPSNTSCPNYPSFTNNKVIVARSCVGLLEYADPNSINYVPDDVTPSDHNGHGTAIAMIAAGELNTSPSGIAIQGVAPKAFLGSYKVQGSPGVNSYATSYGVIAALTVALQDGMDIVTVAYGEGNPPLYGPLDYSASACGGPCDPLAAAVQNAVAQGMVVVASAGNDGNLGPNVPTLNTIHSPGTAPAAITVGSSTNSHALYQAVHAATPAPPANLQTIEALFGDGPQAQAAFSAPIADVTQLGDSDGLACAALTAGSLTGQIALIQRGTCTLDVKVNNAQNAGAAGVVIYQSAGSNPPYSSWGASDTGIPAMMIGYNDGLNLKAWVDAHAGATVTLDPAFSAYATTADTISAFSSRGPAIGTNGIKPELVAPGDVIYTATQKLDPNSPMYNASGYVGVSGTSFAVGMAAGAVALVQQNYRMLNNNGSLTPAELKSAVVNTATVTNLTDPVANTGSAQPRVTAIGAGKLNAGAAVAATTAFNPAALAFGAIVSTSLPESISVTVTNTSSASQTVAFTVNPRDASNATVGVSPTSLTLTAGQSNTVTVTLSGAVPAAGNYEGYIQASVGSNTYRIPYLYMVTDGLVYNLSAALDGSFAGATGDTGWGIMARAIDRYGLPIPNATATWTVTCPNGSSVAYNVGCASSGGGSFFIYGGYYDLDAQTDVEGDAYAGVDLGSLVGDDIFSVSIGGQPLSFDGYAAGYQTPTAVVDAAAYQPIQSPKGYAPGSYLSIFGNYLSAAAQAFSTPALPYALSDVNVSFYSAAGAPYAGRVPYVSPGQVNVQIPWELAGQASAYLQVNVGNEPGTIYQIPLATYSPGVFQFWYPANSAAYADVWDQPAGGGAWYWVTPSSPAHRGDTIHIYANGLGPVNNPPATGAPSGTSATTTSTPAVTIGGASCTVISSGLTPGYIGIYEVVAQIPSNAPNSPSLQPLAISIGNVASAAAYMAMQ